MGYLIVRLHALNTWNLQNRVPCLQRLYWKGKHWKNLKVKMPHVSRALLKRFLTTIRCQPMGKMLNASYATMKACAESHTGAKHDASLEQSKE